MIEFLPPPPKFPGSLLLFSQPWSFVCVYQNPSPGPFQLFLCLFWERGAGNITFVPPEDLLQALILGCIGQRVGQELGSGPRTSGSSKTTEARSEDHPGTLGPAGPPLLGCSQETCGWRSELGSTPISWELLQQRPQQGLAEALSWDACFLAHRHKDGEGVSKLLELSEPRLGLGRDRLWGAARGP